MMAGVVCYFAVEMKNKMRWDDALDVWGVHGIGGLHRHPAAGHICQLAFNPAGTNGLAYGNPGFFVKQLVAVLFSLVWAFGFTYAMLRIIDMFTPVKVEMMSEEIGLDESIHGEHAYETLEVEEQFHGELCTRVDQRFPPEEAPIELLPCPIPEAMPACRPLVTEGDAPRRERIRPMLAA